MKPLLGRMTDGKPVPVVEPDCLEERIKKELVSLGLCDEMEVFHLVHGLATKNMSLIGEG